MFNPNHTKNASHLHVLVPNLSSTLLLQSLVSLSSASRPDNSYHLRQAGEVIERLFDSLVLTDKQAERLNDEGKQEDAYFPTISSVFFLITAPFPNKLGRCVKSK